MATIYIVSSSGKLSKKGDTLQLDVPDGTVTTIFPHKTEQLIVIGNVEITGSALRLVMRHRIDTVFLGANGRFGGKLAFEEGKNVFLRQKQYRLLDDCGFTLAFSRAIACGKLKNQLSFMQRIKRKDRPIAIVEQAIARMKQTIASAENCKDIDALRGHEGMGARLFYSVFRENIIQDWAEFNGRSMHPPEDNVNAVLSFLYTMLFFRVDAAIEAEGLDSLAGYYHALDYGKRTLAFDLMEQWRTPLCDTLACALFNLGILEKSDFEETVFSSASDDFPLKTQDCGNESQTDAFEEKKGVLLTRDGLKKVIPQLEKKFDTELFYEPAGKPLSYKRIIHEQVKHLKRVISGEEKEYKPVVVK